MHSRQKQLSEMMNEKEKIRTHLNRCMILPRAKVYEFATLATLQDLNRANRDPSTTRGSGHAPEAGLGARNTLMVAKFPGVGGSGWPGTVTGMAIMPVTQ
jgi:hypothetical protein